MINRIISKDIASKTGKGKAIVISGPRQVGKTTLIRKLLENTKYLFLDGDDPVIRNILTYPNTEEIKRIIGKNDVVFIDEAQRIPEIGITLKIIIDQFKNVQLYVSGSSSFELSNKINEPLTGRKWEYDLFPICWEEYENHIGYLKSEQQLINRLLFGFYPDVINNPGEEKEILNQLINSYLYRDILALSDIRKPDVLEKLVQALALQIGSEVSYNELAQTVGVDKNTISKYIDILQQGFVIFKIGSFSKNLRNEIKRNKKIYFYDNGVRNMILGNFSNLDLRQDKGALWENFLMAERMKQNEYKNTYTKMYFWRTKQRQEIDLVEEKEGIINAFELKWNAKKNLRIPNSFIEAYKANPNIIDKSNFRDFVVIK